MSRDYYNNQIDISFPCICPVINNECCHNIVKVVYRSTQLSPCEYFDNVMLKFMINSGTDTWKTDVNFFKLKDPS